MATRREKVILDLEDNFTSGMARATAATVLFDKSLNHLSGSHAGVNKDADLAARAVKGLGDEVEKTSTKMGHGSHEIDRYSGRLQLIAEAITVLGPGLVPIGAVGIPAVVGLAAGLGTAAGALGITLLAVQGLGHGLKALNAYQIEPTKANLEKMRAEMDKLGPSGAEFVRLLDSLEPQLRGLQEVARAGLLPGVQDAIEPLLSLMPQVRVIIFNLATEMGRLSAEAGRALSGEGFAAFFDYLETEAGPLLSTFSHTLGNVAEGFANLFVAFGPLTGDFAAGMERMSQSFADWAAGLSQTQGFRDFVAYVRETGPQVVELLGALATAFFGIIKAAAPVGAAVVPALTALARVLATIADSPIGPALFTGVAAMLAINRAASLAATGINKVKLAADASNASMGKMGAGANFLAILTGIGAINAAFSSLRDNIDTTNLDRNLQALARGETINDLANLGKELANVGSTFAKVDDKFSDILTIGIDTSELERSQKEIEKVDQALAAMVESGSRDVAERAFQQIMDQAAAAGVSASDAAKNFDAYKTALDNAGPSAEEAAAAQRRYTEANNLSARVARQTRTEINGLVSAMEEQTNAALSAFDAVTQYGDALAAARDAAKKGKRGIDENTEAGRENRSALSQLAAAWNNQSDAVRNNVSKFNEARDAFIRTATAMGVPEQKARDLAKRLMEIPRSVVIKMDAKADPVLQAVARIKRELASIPRSISTTYYVNQINRANKGPVTGPGSQNYVGGWTGPGGKYQAVGTVHADEVVIPKELVHRDAKMLKARYGFLPGMADLPGYASGGYVGRYARAGAGGTPAFADLGPVGGEFIDLLMHLNGLGKRELEHRARLLDRQETLADKALDLAKKRVDEERAQLKDLRDQRKQFMQDVTSNFRTDVFGGGVNLEQYVQQQGLPAGFDSAQAYIASLTPGQLGALQAQASIGGLQQDATQAGAFNYVLDQLRQMGLTGGAYSELAASGNYAQANAYLQMGPDFIKTLMHDYQQREDALKNLGQNVGNAQFGADIREQLKETRQATRVAQEARDSLRTIERAQHDIAARLDRIEKNAPKKTGDAVGAAINGAVKHGQQRG